MCQSDRRRCRLFMVLNGRLHEYSFLVCFTVLSEMYYALTTIFENLTARVRSGSKNMPFLGLKCFSHELEFRAKALSVPVQLWTIS